MERHCTKRKTMTYFPAKFKESITIPFGDRKIGKMYA